MYAVPQAFKNIVRDLTPDAGSPGNARITAFIELTLTLAVRLGLDAEPLTVGWVLLSRMPLHHTLLKRLSSDQKRMLANAAVIVPLSSRFAWENALVHYAKSVPMHMRLYAVNPDARLDGQLINLCRQQPSPDQGREDRYEAILTRQLAYEKRNHRAVSPGETYNVRVRMSDKGIRYGHVKINDLLQPSTSQPVWFDAPRPRTVIHLELKDLIPTANFLDEREVMIGGRSHWRHDLMQIRFRRVTWDGDTLTLDEQNAHPLHLEGAVHLPGMVSAGKTTLAKLIIAHCIHTGIDARITLVVGDSHSAIETAHQINSWFFDDPAGDDVAAVPILGVSQRETHLGRLLSSQEYARSLQTRRPHWGERWLMPTCPLAARIVWDGDEDVTIPAGNEPCEGLTGKPRAGRGRGERHLCPLFHNCPSKQSFRDMPRAQVWVTTPGALAQAALPLHLDARVAKIGDLVYEQSDLVILDEVETIIEWFDRTFAQREELTNGKHGLLDRLDTQISQYWSANRVLPSDYRRWIIPARESLKVLSGALTAIADPDQERTVRQWVRRGYFAPNQLAYRFARRLAGLKEWDAANTPATVKHEHEKQTQLIFEPFNQLLNRTPDALRYQLPRNPTEIDKAVSELAALMQMLNNLSDDFTDVLLQCQQWILRWHSDIEARLEALQTTLSQSDDRYDQDYLEKHIDRSVGELAERLQFLLTVALMDRHLHIVLEEWHNKPETLDAQEPFSRIPRGMKSILPLPLTGQQYGFVSDTAGIEHNREAANRLSLFTYANIGRSYLLDFPHLRQAFDGLPGPHVLALSGTSYLPDSTTFHVTLPPAGVLIAPEQTEQAIRDSRFIWQYFTDVDGKPIAVSGEHNKEQQLRLLMKAMLDYHGVPGGFFARVLTWLRAQSTADPEQWADRQRVLLLTNSYKQAHAAAQLLRDRWRSEAHTIYELQRGKVGEDYEVEFLEQSGKLRRVDIEQFAKTNGRILIAPMQSIGRGFNILNDQSKAVFGAVFFLTRPMDHPNNPEAIAQELNRYALEWANHPEFEAWQEDTLYKRAIKAREKAVELRRLIGQRHGYRHLRDFPTLRLYPRRDLAATTVGRIVQAVGRLLRGGVPFRAYFVDAAWSPRLAEAGDPAQTEDENTSLLTAMIDIISAYADADEIGRQLYGSLSEALITTENRDSN